jgi:hypothetical protein
MVWEEVGLRGWRDVAVEERVRRLARRLLVAEGWVEEEASGAARLKGLGRSSSATLLTRACLVGSGGLVW